MIRRRLLSAVAAVSALLPSIGRGASGDSHRRLHPVDLPDLVRIDAAEADGWLARDRSGRMWRIREDGSARPIADGLHPDAPLDARHGLIASHAPEGRLWVMRDSPSERPSLGDERMAPHGGLLIVPGAIVGLVSRSGRTVVARFEASPAGPWTARTTSEDAVLPDAEPVLVDLDGQHSGEHLAVLAGPDATRYGHGVLGDAIEATRVLWLDRGNLRVLRQLDLDAPYVFEDRLLRPWRLPDGRLGLVTMQAGPQGAQIAVLAASPTEPGRLRIELRGPPIGQRNRWMSPAVTRKNDPDMLVIHTPHIGGVLRRYAREGSGLVSRAIMSGVTNHRLGERRLDNSARVGPWILLSTQGWDELAVVDLRAEDRVERIPMPASIVQIVASSSGTAAAVLTRAGLMLWKRPAA